MLEPTSRAFTRMSSSIPSSSSSRHRHLLMPIVVFVASLLVLQQRVCDAAAAPTNGIHELYNSHRLHRVDENTVDVDNNYVHEAAAKTASKATRTGITVVEHHDPSTTPDHVPAELCVNDHVFRLLERSTSSTKTANTNAVPHIEVTFHSMYVRPVEQHRIEFENILIENQDSAVIVFETRTSKQTQERNIKITVVQFLEDAFVNRLSFSIFKSKLDKEVKEHLNHWMSRTGTSQNVRNNDQHKEELMFQAKDDLKVIWNTSATNTQGTRTTAQRQQQNPKNQTTAANGDFENDDSSTILQENCQPFLLRRKDALESTIHSNSKI